MNVKYQLDKNNIVYAAADDADNLLNGLIGTTPNLATGPEQNLPQKEESKQNEQYQLPIRGAPWIVGEFSPGVATDANHPQGHNGADQKAPRGTSVFPIASGTVKATGVGEKSGNYVTCLHEAGTVQSFYAHLDSVSVSSGQAVTQNTEIGKVGDTGNAKNIGAHTHFEVKVNGSLMNPLSIIGKPVGSLSRKAMINFLIEKFANDFLNTIEKNDNQTDEPARIGENPELDRLEQINDYLDSEHPDMPSWIRETIVNRTEYAWEAAARLGYGIYGRQFRKMVEKITKAAIEDLEAGKLERIV